MSRNDMHCCLKACWTCVRCSRVHRLFARGLYVPWVVIALAWVWRCPPVCAGTKLWGRRNRWDAWSWGDCDCDSGKCLSVEDNATAGPLGSGQPFSHSVLNIAVLCLCFTAFRFGQRCMQTVHLSLSFRADPAEPLIDNFLVALCCVVGL